MTIRLNLFNLLNTLLKPFLNQPDNFKTYDELKEKSATANYTYENADINPDKTDLPPQNDRCCEK